MTGDRPAYARFFDAIARRYDRAYGLDARTSRARAARVLRELPPRANVLDLGVGTGRELSALQDADHRITGVEISPEMVALCERRARPIPIAQCDFWEPLPFRDGEFDAVLALHGTLAHPPSEEAPSRLAGEVARVLGRAGVFVAELPSHAWLERIGAEIVVGDRRVRRIDRDRCVYEDLVVGASIEAWIPDDARWLDVLSAAGLAAVSERMNDDEMLVVAHRR